MTFQHRTLPSWLALSLLLICGFASAHEGHDHDAESESIELPQASAAAPRLALHSTRVELVAAREGADLLLYIDDYETNSPLPGLRVQLRAGTRLLQASGVAPGLYRIPADLLSADGPQPVTFSLQGEGWQEELSGVLPAALPVVAPPSSPGWKWIAAAAAAGVLVIGLALLVLRRRSRKPAA